MEKQKLNIQVPKVSKQQLRNEKMAIQTIANMLPPIGTP